MSDSDTTLVLLERLAKPPKVEDGRRWASRYYNGKGLPPLPSDLDWWWQEEISPYNMLSNVGLMVDRCFPWSQRMFFKLVLVCARSWTMSTYAYEYILRLEEWVKLPFAFDWNAEFEKNQHNFTVHENYIVSWVQKAAMTNELKHNQIAYGLISSLLNYYVAWPENDGRDKDELCAEHMARMVNNIRLNQPKAPRIGEQP